MNISIIIPTFNKLPRLKLCLYSLEKLEYCKKQFEVIVVNDGSSDGTFEYLESYTTSSLQLSCIHTTNLGRSHARNVGVKAARGKILLFIDDDLIIEKNLLQLHEEMHSEENTVVHGAIFSLPRLKFFYNPVTGELYKEFSSTVKNLTAINNSCIQYKDIEENFEEKIVQQSKSYALEKIIVSALGTDYQWIAFTGANTSVKKEIFLKYGMFNEDFGTLWGCEDMEAGYKLHKAGCKFIYQPKARVYHISHYRDTMNEEHQKSVERFYGLYKDQTILTFASYVNGEINANQFIDKIKTSKLISNRGLDK